MVNPEKQNKREYPYYMEKEFRNSLAVSLALPSLLLINGHSSR
jgi:hypothetical protein